MTASPLSHLLPNIGQTQDPNAYQVFGLPVGTSDPAQIETAIQKTVAHLKAQKANSEPAVWARAARTVQQAREILLDDKRKAKLDAKLQPRQGGQRGGNASASGEPMAPAPADGSDADPLAALLPNADPFATPATPPPAVTEHSALGESEPTSEASAPIEAPAHIPSVLTPEDVQPASHSEAASFVLQTEEIPRRGSVSRRRKSAWGPLVFASVTLGLCGVIAVLTYFLFFGPGQLSINKSDRGLAISTQRAEPESSPANPSTGNPPASPSQPPDSVMGNLAANSDRGRTLEKPSGLTDGLENRLPGETDIASMLTPMQQPANDQDMASPGSMSASPDSDSPGTEPATPDSMTEDAMTSADSTGDNADTPEPLPAGSPEDAASETAAKELARVETLIRQAEWAEMKAAAEAAKALPMTPQQKQRAEGLWQLAELATYYHGGLLRAIAALEIGNDFEVAPDFRVIVVEKGEDYVVVRFNTKNKRFTVDELPFSLAHTLATFSMPESATSEAAKAAYQAIAPRATPGHRQQSIQWLQSIAGEVEGSDPALIAETIDQLYTAAR